MGFIYRLTNKINSKTYIGKTNLLVENRIKQHINEARKSKNQNRPLYRAIKKYGISSFIYETLEETENTSEKEIFWIKFFGSYKYGYNATIGGDGKSSIDYKKVMELYNSGQKISVISQTLGCNRDTLYKYFKGLGISSKENSKNLGSKRVICLSTGMEFNSITEAAIFTEKLFGLSCKEGAFRYKISLCCEGKRKTVLGCKFQFIT